MILPLLAALLFGRVPQSAPQAIDLPDIYQFIFDLREVTLNGRAESISGDATVVLKTLPPTV